MDATKTHLIAAFPIPIVAILRCYLVPSHGPIFTEFLLFIYSVHVFLNLLPYQHLALVSQTFLNVLMGPSKL